MAARSGRTSGRARRRDDRSERRLDIRSPCAGVPPLLRHRRARDSGAVREGVGLAGGVGGMLEQEVHGEVDLAQGGAARANGWTCRLLAPAFMRDTNQERSPWDSRCLPIRASGTNSAAEQNARPIIRREAPREYAVVGWCVRRGQQCPSGNRCASSAGPAAQPLIISSLSCDISQG